MTEEELILKAKLNVKFYQYKALEKAIYEENVLRDMSLMQYAKQQGIDYQQALQAFSHMLKNHNEHFQQPEVCPSCGQDKQLKPGNKCRDYFHIV